MADRSTSAVSVGLDGIVPKTDSRACVAAVVRLVNAGWRSATHLGRRRLPRLSRIGLALAQNAANDETDIGRTFAQPAHEVGEPFTAEWNIDAQREAFSSSTRSAGRGGSRTASGIRSSPVGMPRSGANARVASIIAGSCVAIAGKVPSGEQDPHDPHERRVDVCLGLIGDVARLLVGPLDQPHARAELVHPRRVRLASRQVRLQHRRRRCDSPAATSSRTLRA